VTGLESQTGIVLASSPAPNQRKRDRYTVTGIPTEHGEKKAREILEEGFRRMDERNLVNMETKEPPE